MFLLFCFPGMDIKKMSKSWCLSEFTSQEFFQDFISKFEDHEYKTHLADDTCTAYVEMDARIK